MSPDGVPIDAAKHRSSRAGEVSLTGARAPDQHDVATSRQERACVQRADQSLVDRSVLKDERVDVLHDRQLGGFHAVADRGRMAVCAFGAQQIGQISIAVRWR